MKKFIATLLCVFTLLAFSACDKKVSTDKQFKDAYDKTMALDSYEYKMTTVQVTSTEGVNTKTQMEITTKIDNAKAEKPVSSSTIKQNVPMLGEVSSSTYTDDKYIYIDDGESKTKLSLDDENLKDMIELLGGSDSDISDTLVEIPSDLLKDVELKKGDNDSKSFELTLTDEQFKESFKKLFDAMSATGDLFEGMEVTIAVKDAKVSVTMNKDGYISAYEISYTMDMSMSFEGKSTTTSSNVSTKLEFVNPGEKVTVTAPADLDKYEDFEMPDFGDLSGLIIN